MSLTVKCTLSAECHSPKCYYAVSRGAKKTILILLGFSNSYELLQKLNLTPLVKAGPNLIENFTNLKPISQKIMCKFSLSFLKAVSFLSTEK